MKNIVTSVHRKNAANDSGSKKSDKSIHSNEQRAKILIVDDREDNLFATRKVLKHLDADVLEANSGNKALSLMLRHRFAVVLLDVQMPEMDGFETATLMKEDESMRDTPIIFVTAINKEEHYANHAAELGAVDYIFKPVNPFILESKVKVYVNLFNQREKIYRLNEVLTHNNTELERFAYICSHDLKEPARNIQNFAVLMTELDRETQKEESDECVNIITNCAGRMLDLIQGILDYSRVDGKADSFSEVNCNEILTIVKSNFEHTISSNNVRIESGNLPLIMANHIQILQLFQNLIGNGIKFNDKPEIVIRLSCKEKSSAWEFSISDNGLGIEDKYHKKIFDVFQRLHRREAYPGSGIGLSVCQKIVTKHNGRLWLESTPGKGSIFYFTIPK